MSNPSPIPGALCAYYDYEIQNVTTGEVKKASEWIPCHSFLDAFLRAIYMQTKSTSSIHDSAIRQFPDGGTEFNTYVFNVRGGANGTLFVTSASTGNANLGIVVGTGSNPVTIGDYRLQTKINSGVAAGELQYGTVSYGAPSSDATKTTFRTTRVFTNNSGGAVLITEIGLVMSHNISTLTETDFRIEPYLIMRDLTSINVADGQQVTINYNMVAYP